MELSHLDIWAVMMIALVLPCMICFE
jgi:hypothetical protein